MSSRFHKHLRWLLLLVGIMPGFRILAQGLIDANDSKNLLPIGKKVEMLAVSNPLLPDSVAIYSGTYAAAGNNTLVFRESNVDTWLRFSAVNHAKGPLFLIVQSPGLPYLAFYRMDSSRLHLISKTGTSVPYEDRQEDDVSFIFSLHLKVGETGTYYLHIRSDHPLSVPILLGTRVPIEHSTGLNVFIIGAYCGILLVIFFYNLFIYFSVNDRSYLTYIIYVFFLGMAQITSSGFGFKYVWPGLPFLNRYMIVLSSSLTCVMATVFAYYFLQFRKYTPSAIWLILYLFLSYAVAIICNFADLNSVSYRILDINALIISIGFILLSGYIARQGFRAAYFYLVAWSFLLLGTILYVSRNLGFLPSNLFINYVFYIGSSLEAILLSNALADRINILKKEKQISQEEALRASLENERLVREQNLILEAKVHERTVELEESNRSVNEALDNLKATQSQLVEAEKMASLGVLTAGIAHEINNPINFVKSNIKPLQLDIQDLWEVIAQYEEMDLEEDFEAQLLRISAYKKKIDLTYIKQEIASLLKGIEDGATRTAEIVRGLRTFSRLDETELKKVNLYEGLDSTLVLLRSSMPVNVQVVRAYQPVPAVECFPGKLNQVFLNIMSNALYAMDKKHSGQTEYLTVSTALYDPESVEIRISDTGTGMPASVKEKIFDPFFTTKDIGEGTGLGLSIVFNIIEKHKGKIIVHSNIGSGTEFQIILPIVHPSN